MLKPLKLSALKKILQSAKPFEISFPNSSLQPAILKVSLLINVKNIFENMIGIFHIKMLFAVNEQYKELY